MSGEKHGITPSTGQSSKQLSLNPTNTFAEIGSLKKALNERYKGKTFNIRDWDPNTSPLFRRDSNGHLMIAVIVIKRIRTDRVQFLEDFGSSIRRDITKLEKIKAEIKAEIDAEEEAAAKKRIDATHKLPVSQSSTNFMADSAVSEELVLPHVSVTAYYAQSKLPVSQSNESLMVSGKAPKKSRLYAVKGFYVKRELPASQVSVNVMDSHKGSLSLELSLSQDESCVSSSPRRDTLDSPRRYVLRRPRRYPSSCSQREPSDSPRRYPSSSSQEYQTPKILNLRFFDKSRDGIAKIEKEEDLSIKKQEEYVLSIINKIGYLLIIRGLVPGEKPTIDVQKTIGRRQQKIARIIDDSLEKCFDPNLIAALKKAIVTESNNNSTYWLIAMNVDDSSNGAALNYWERQIKKIEMRHDALVEKSCSGNADFLQDVDEIDLSSQEKKTYLKTKGLLDKITRNKNKSNSEDERKVLIYALLTSYLSDCTNVVLLQRMIQYIQSKKNNPVYRSLGLERGASDVSVVRKNFWDEQIQRIEIRIGEFGGPSLSARTCA